MWDACGSLGLPVWIHVSATSCHSFKPKFAADAVASAAGIAQRLVQAQSASDSDPA